MRARLLRAAAAVLAGNAIYFVLLLRRLPAWLRHRPFTLDAGLALDFLICAAIFLALGLVPNPARRSSGPPSGAAPP